jgi:hypothetical protein
VEREPARKPGRYRLDSKELAVGGAGRAGLS